MQTRRYGWVVVGGVAVAARLVAACSGDDSTTALADAGASDAFTVDSGNDDAGPCMPAVPKAPADLTKTGCDLSAQNCGDPCNPKCTLYATNPKSTTIGSEFVACGEVLGDASLDEECTRPSSIIGDDTCARGYFCSAIGKPKTATSTRVCKKVCSQNSQCGADEFCVSITGAGKAVAQAGICVATCDPFGDACPSGNACDSQTDVTGTVNLACSLRAPAGDAGAGSACKYDSTGNDPCPYGTVCAGSDGSALTCKTLCDESHPCAQDAGACSAIGNATYMVCQ